MREREIEREGGMEMGRRSERTRESERKKRQVGREMNGEGKREEWRGREIDR